MSRGRRRTGRPHHYTPSTVVPADHTGQPPCVCGRPRTNGRHTADAVAQVDAEQAEHRRRIGDED